MPSRCKYTVSDHLLGERKDNCKNNLPWAGQACYLQWSSCLHGPPPPGRKAGCWASLREGGRPGRGLRFPSGSGCCAVSWEAGVALLPVGLLFARLFWPAPCCQDCHPGNSGGTWPASESAGVSPAVGPPHGPSTGITLVKRDVFGGILSLRSSLSLVRVT